MGPVGGFELCRGEHRFMLVASGQLAVRVEDGARMEFGPGDGGSVPSGHESWVVGDERAVAMGIDPAP